MAKIDKQYHQLANAIIETGYKYKTDNRSQECLQISSANLEIDLLEFPLLTTKKMFTKGVVEELLWFLRGDSNIKSLVKKDVHIWNKDAFKYNQKIHPIDEASGITLEEFVIEVLGSNSNSTGSVGRNYGVQWRDWTKANMYAGIGQISSFDQITILLNNLRKPNPINRRHIVTAWNPAELEDTALPPCHWSWEIIVRPLSASQRIRYSGGDITYLEALWSESMKNNKEAEEILARELAHIPSYGFILKWHQRSVDTFLGLPFNIASYALLAHIIASIVDMVPLSIIGDLSNVHFYEPHISIVKEQLQRSPIAYSGPRLEFSQNYIHQLEFYKGGAITFDQFLEPLTHKDFVFHDYESFGSLKGEMYEPTT